MAMLNDKDKRIILALAENNMKWKIAARAIDLHWNTVAYRLDRIYDQTGLDPRNFYDLHKLVEMAQEED